MKKLYYGLLLLVAVVQSNAQSARVNLCAGVDMSRLSFAGYSGKDVSSRTGVGAEVAIEVIASPVFSVQTGIDYSSQGAGYKLESIDEIGSYEFNYVTIPFLFKLYPLKNLNLLAGPQIGFLSKATHKEYDGMKTDIQEQVRATSYYFLFGSEYRFDNGIFIGARYNLGLGELGREQFAGPEIKSRYFSFRTGYSIPLK